MKQTAIFSLTCSVHQKESIKNIGLVSNKKRRPTRGKNPPERQKKTASILSGIHYRDSRGMLQINLSDAFSVLLTFSSSPKRHVVCQGAFIKLDRRENNVKTHDFPRRHTDRLSQRRCLLLSSTGAAAHSFLPEEQPFFLYPSAGQH